MSRGTRLWHPCLHAGGEFSARHILCVVIFWYFCRANAEEQRVCWILRNAIFNAAVHYGSTVADTESNSLFLSILFFQFKVNWLRFYRTENTLSRCYKYQLVNLFREIITGYSHNRMKRINTLWAECSPFTGKAAGIYNNYRATECYVHFTNNACHSDLGVFNGFLSIAGIVKRQKTAGNRTWKCMYICECLVVAVWQIFSWGVLN